MGLSERITKIKGKITKPIANAAGDRRSEAKNALEAKTGQKPEGPTVDAVEHLARKKHGDV